MFTPCLTHLTPCRRGEDRYLIRWQSSGKEKHVRRFNLIFEGESMDHFKQRIFAAVRRREEVGPAG